MLASFSQTLLHLNRTRENREAHRQTDRKKMTNQNQRPSWVKDVEHTPERTYMIVAGSDGKLRGISIPSRSMRDKQSNDCQQIV
jgi:hypothetical protein